MLLCHFPGELTQNSRRHHHQMLLSPRKNKTLNTMTTLYLFINWCCHKRTGCYSEAEITQKVFLGTKNWKLWPDFPWRVLVQKSRQRHELLMIFPRVSTAYYNKVPCKVSEGTPFRKLTHKRTLASNRNWFWVQFCLKLRQWGVDCVKIYDMHIWVSISSGSVESPRVAWLRISLRYLLFPATGHVPDFLQDLFAAVLPYLELHLDEVNALRSVQ